MSRLARYKDSFIRFIKDKSIISDKQELSDKEYNKLISKLIFDNKRDFTLSILFLTIMNSQNKKNKVTLQGYHGACSVEFLRILIESTEEKNRIINAYNLDTYYKLINYLIVCSNSSLMQNIESIKDYIPKEKMADILLNTSTIFYSTISSNNLLFDFKFEVSDDLPNQKLLKWYIKDNQILKNNFLKLKRVKIESFQEYLNKKIGKLCEYTLITSWLLGCGNYNDINKVKKIASYFTFIYKLTLDFENVETDLLNIQENYTSNYVINYGLQESYELFMYHKQKFLEDAMMLDIYTTTIKELIASIEHRVDIVIDQTSPDLRSNYSNALLE